MARRFMRKEQPKIEVFLDPDLDFSITISIASQLYAYVRTYITGVVCKRTSRSVMSQLQLPCPAACRSGTLGFGDGNGCAPPGLRKPAPGLGIGVVSTPDEWPERKKGNRTHNRAATFEIPAPS